MRYRLLLLLTLLLGFSMPVVVQASERHKATATKKAKHKVTISKKTAINVAKSEIRGKVLSAKLIQSRGPAVYRIKMLIGESRVRTVFVDGVSGRVIRIN